jgi:hypothetical protein
MKKLKWSPKQVQLRILDGSDRGGEKTRHDLQSLYLLKSGADADGREYRLYVDLPTKTVFLWAQGKPTRAVAIGDLVAALLSEGREP